MVHPEGPIRNDMKKDHRQHKAIPNLIADLLEVHRGHQRVQMYNDLPEALMSNDQLEVLMRVNHRVILTFRNHQGTLRFNDRQGLQMFGNHRGTLRFNDLPEARILDNHQEVQMNVKEEDNDLPLFSPS